MPRNGLLFGCMILLFFLSACSSETAVELTHTSVDIIKDKEKTGSIIITSGENKGEELIPTALYYEFTIKNIGSKKITDIEDLNLEIKIQPHDSLIESSRKIIGFNIYNPENYENTGLGSGQIYATNIEKDDEETFSVYYELGVSEENEEVSLLVPSKEELDELISHAREATLIIEMGEEEIARFDME